MVKVNLNKERIREMRKADSKRTAVSMANELEISRERVRQILNDLGLPTAFLKAQRVCENEGCEKLIGRRSSSKTCSRECFKAHRIGSFVCDYCGKTKVMAKFLIAIQRSRYLNIYCNRSCRGLGSWAKRKKRNEVFANT